MSERTRLERDLGSLVLRVTVGGLMLFHGVDKALHGVTGIGKMLEGAGLPSMLAYGVYVGEILAPALLVLGIAMRTSAAMLVFTMAMAVYLLHAGDVMALGSHGEYALELHALYAFGAVAAALVGPGRLAVPVKGWARRL